MEERISFNLDVIRPGIAVFVSYQGLKDAYYGIISFANKDIVKVVKMVCYKADEELIAAREIISVDEVHCGSISIKVCDSVDIGPIVNSADDKLLRFETGQRVKVYTCLLEMGQKEPYNGLIAEVGNAFVDVILVAHSHYVGKAESVLFRVRNKSLAVFRFYERDILSGVVRIEKED